MSRDKFTEQQCADIWATGNPKASLDLSASLLVLACGAQLRGETIEQFREAANAELERMWAAAQQVVDYGKRHPEAKRPQPFEIPTLSDDDCEAVITTDSSGMADTLDESMVHLAIGAQHEGEDLVDFQKVLCDRAAAAWGVATQVVDYTHRQMNAGKETS